MEFYEYLQNQSEECIEIMRSHRAKKANQADVDAANNRLNKLTTAVEIYSQWEQFNSERKES